MISASLQKAIDSLHIQDVYLKELTARCDDDFEPKYAANCESLVISTKHQVREAIILEMLEQEKILRVLVDIGVRWFDENSPDEESSVKALIEAVFVAEYSMDEMLEKDSVNEFSLKNVSYHIWPYWRELLSSQCDRMHLPKVILPMMQLADNHFEKNNKEMT